MQTEKDNKTINILGTDYNINFVPENNDRLQKLGADGYTDTTTKDICIAYFEPDERSVKNLDYYQRKVMRHEIIHAFCYESGLWNNSGRVDGWAINEEMVDYIAIQHSKMHEAFKQAGAL